MNHLHRGSTYARTYCNPYCNRADTHWYTMDKGKPPDHRKPPKQAQFPDAPGWARTYASKLLGGAAVSGSSPLVGPSFCADLQVKHRASLRPWHRVGADLLQPGANRKYTSKCGSQVGTCGGGTASGGNAARRSSPSCGASDPASAVCRRSGAIRREAGR